jgi:hypothetical protein
VGVQGTAFADLTTLSPTALTPTLGLFMQFNEKASLGITVGWDHLSSADSKANWKHNKQWWFGMGFNIGISDYKPKAASTEKEQSKEDE